MNAGRGTSSYEAREFSGFECVRDCISHSQEAQRIANSLNPLAHGWTSSASPRGTDQLGHKLARAEPLIEAVCNCSVNKTNRLRDWNSAVSASLFLNLNHACSVECVRGGKSGQT